jgi:hypothetical protein
VLGCRGAGDDAAVGALAPPPTADSYLPDWDVRRTQWSVDDRTHGVRGDPVAFVLFGEAGRRRELLAGLIENSDQVGDQHVKSLTFGFGRL